MSFISVYYVIFVFLLNILFYGISHKYRMYILLVGSLFFITLYSKYAAIWIIAASLMAYLFGSVIQKSKFCNTKTGLFLGIGILVFPLFFLKYLCPLMQGTFSELIVPVGISFYTLSLISYVVDVWKGKYDAEKNVWKFILFTIFFPQIVQGPIARFDCWKNNLNKIYKFEYREYTFGWQLIVWGYFLKFVVADKAGIMVNTVYENPVELPGIYILTAAILYSIQLYADFCGCVNIAIGTAQTFGIVLQPNFRQPYFAESIRDFWRRWHLTLSNWLRDYVYIPLGGNQKGKVRQCINILVVFVVSGIWHGFGLNFVLWGILHGIYQVFEIIFDRIGLPVNRKQGNRCSRVIKILITFVLVTFGWMLFRAQSVEQFLNLLRQMFSTWNPEAILDGNAYYRMGLSRLQTLPLILGIAGLFVVDLLHERGISIRKKVSEYPIVLRWMIYLAVIMFILIFGTYGPAYADNQFIYGKF